MIRVKATFDGEKRYKISNLPHLYFYSLCFFKLTFLQLSLRGFYTVFGIGKSSIISQQLWKYKIIPPTFKTKHFGKYHRCQITLTGARLLLACHLGMWWRQMECYAFPQYSTITGAPVLNDVVLIHRKHPHNAQRTFQFHISTC